IDIGARRLVKAEEVLAGVEDDGTPAYGIGLFEILREFVSNELHFPNDQHNVFSIMKTSPTKSAVVTGASGGIGRMVAKRLASDSFAITVHYSGNPAKAEALVVEINNAGGKAIAVQADVAIAADVERLFKESMEAFGGPDVVVHCAGIMPLFPIASGNVATFDKVIATNLRG